MQTERISVPNLICFVSPCPPRRNPSPNLSKRLPEMVPRLPTKATKPAWWLHQKSGPERTLSTNPSLPSRSANTLPNTVSCWIHWSTTPRWLTMPISRLSNCSMKPQYAYYPTILTLAGFRPFQGSFICVLECMVCRNAWLQRKIPRAIAPSSHVIHFRHSGQVFRCQC